jgi:hypothetical protein
LLAFYLCSATLPDETFIEAIKVKKKKLQNEKTTKKNVFIFVSHFCFIFTGGRKDEEKEKNAREMYGVRLM